MPRPAGRRLRTIASNVVDTAGVEPASRSVKSVCRSQAWYHLAINHAADVQATFFDRLHHLRFCSELRCRRFYEVPIGLFKPRGVLQSSLRHFVICRCHSRDALACTFQSFNPVETLRAL